MTRAPSASPIAGTTYHLAPDGDDRDAGTAAKPWATLAYCRDEAAAGRHPRGGSGTYKRQSVDWKTSGSAAGPITIRAAAGSRPVFDGDGEGHFAVIRGGAGYVVFDGLTITGYDIVDDGIIVAMDGAHDLTFQNLRMTGNDGQDQRSHLIYLGSPDVHDIVIRANLLDGIKGGAIHLYHAPNAQHVLITDNVLRDSHWGVIVTSGANNVVIDHNTFIDNDVGVEMWDATGVQVSNNLVTSDHGTGIRLQKLAPLAEDYDLWQIHGVPFVIDTDELDLAGWQAATGEGTHSTVVVPGVPLIGTDLRRAGRQPGGRRRKRRLGPRHAGLPVSGIRRTAALARQSGAWSPAVARHLLTDARRGRGAGQRPSAGLPASPAHLEAAAGWLRRAQDATVDGGVSWGYRLNGGWAASYPETTGYIVPTYLALADAAVGGGTGVDARASGATAGPSDVDRARRAISFLLGIQLPSGAFPGARIDQNRTAPSVFNTGQILNGLVAWHRATDDPATADAAARAAAWLVSSQEPDGAWSRDVYNRLEVSYLAHATCWLAEYGEHAGDAVALAAAGKHLDRLLQRYDPATGWFDGAGFSAEDHAARRSVTHTLAYTIWGVLDLGLRLGRAEAVEAATRSAARVAEVVHRDGRLAGMVDASWSALSDWDCLTGSSQMALIWFRLARLGDAAGDLDAAHLVLDRVRGAQDLGSRDPGIRGGIAGSDPAWGEYLRFVLPNWAAKFTIDAFLEEARMAATAGAGPAS